MNNRIKELASCNERIQDFFLTGPVQRAAIEKFAGLIVAECMEVFSKDLPEPGDGKMLEVINRVCAVAEHFGVEE